MLLLSSDAFDYFVDLHVILILISGANRCPFDKPVILPLNIIDVTRF